MRGILGSINSAFAIAVTCITSNCIARGEIEETRVLLRAVIVCLTILSLLEIVPFYADFEFATKLFLHMDSDRDALLKILEAFVIIVILYNFVESIAGYLR
jgi:Na+-driven multidrug efflux pump